MQVNLVTFLTMTQLSVIAAVQEFGFSVCFSPQDKGEMIKYFDRLFTVKLTLSKG